MNTRETACQNNLKRVLCKFIVSRYCDQFTTVLAKAAKARRISYDEVQTAIHTDPEDALFLANEWGFLYPVQTLRSAAWEDRVLFAKPGEIYEMPNIVSTVIGNVCNTGKWDLTYGITEIFKKMGESKWELMPELIQHLQEESIDYKINAQQIKKICVSFILGNRINALIAELKASGVMSPKLSSPIAVARAHSPIYELNRVLFIKEDDT